MAIEKLGWEALERTQPSGSLPPWVIPNATTSKRRIREGLWALEFYIFKKRILAPGDAWERRPDGSKILTCLDPETGEKRYVISYLVSEDERVVLFRAEIEVASRTVSTLEAMSVADMDPARYELYYETG